VEVRHLRILALCLLAVFATSATTLAVASPALAGEKCNQECKEQKEKEKEEAKEQKEKEKQEAKEQKESEKQRAKERKEKEKEEAKQSKGLEGVWERFNECPSERGLTWADPLSDEDFGQEYELSGCLTGLAEKESFFKAGKVTVYFKKPVAMHVGFIEDTEGEFYTVPARNGESVVREAEPGPSLTTLDAELLPEAERARYEEYLANGGSTATTETIELVPGTRIRLHEGADLSEEGEAFGFEVMIHIQNKFLGDHCYDGTANTPINVPFTTGETSPPPPNTPIHGTVGAFSSEAEGTILNIKGQHLVDNEYAVPGVSGCGVAGRADAAIDAGLGLPSPAGSNTTELVGHLWQAGAEPVRENAGE
jgi:hypothetical protein